MLANWKLLFIAALALLVCVSYVNPASISTDALAASEKITVADDNDGALSLPDFDGDGNIGFGDFVLFAGVFGSSQGDEEYNARYDLNGDGEIGFTDFVIFAQDFGKDVPSPEFSKQQIFNDNVFVLPITENLVVDRAPSALAMRDYTRHFYGLFADEFDFLLVVRNLIYGVDFDGVICARYIAVKNDVQGTGAALFSDEHSWGSSGRLQGVITFNYVATQSGPEWAPIGRGPGLHEFMHRWANFVLPTADGAHWGFSSANGLLGGFDIINLVDHGDNRYTAGEFNTNGSHGQPFSPIEQYLAGFISPEEVPDLWVAEDGEWVRDSEGGILRASNGYKIFSASQIKTYTIADIISEHGPRVPGVSRSQRDFRAAVILLTDEKHPANRRVLERLSEDVSWTSHAAFTEEGDNPVGNAVWKTNFYESTGGRATIAMDGLSHFQSRVGAKRLAPISFGKPTPPIVDRRE